MTAFSYSVSGRRGAADVRAPLLFFCWLGICAVLGVCLIRQWSGDAIAQGAYCLIAPEAGSGFAVSILCHAARTAILVASIALIRLHPLGLWAVAGLYSASALQAGLGFGFLWAAGQEIPLGFLLAVYTLRILWGGACLSLWFCGACARRGPEGSGKARVFLSAFLPWAALDLLIVTILA